MLLKRISLLVLGAFLLLLALQLAVTGSDAPAAPDRGALKIGGTGGANGAIALVADAFKKKHPEFRFVFSPSLGSTGGIKAVISGAMDLGLSSRPLTEAELRQGAVAVEYGRTPIMLVTSHPGAGLNLTLKQIAALYAGELSNYPDGTQIRLILRPWVESDTSFLLNLSPEIAEAVAKAHARPGLIVAVTDQDNAEKLEKIKGAIGWLTLAQLIPEKRQVTPVSIGGIMPGLATLASGAYPYYKPFSVVTLAPPAPQVKAFIDFLTSRQGQEILSKSGLLVNEKRP
ncbi:MAG: substrate-binding domain-containing protein [Syntrophobacterales bacterium]|jgi:phosphate transport system substrate-binding protein|nr:substrate-binding domain-containing protein [Syntrophobacterales bacterium]